MNLKKSDFAQKTNDLLTAQGMEKILSLITYCATSAGISAGSAGLIFCYYFSVCFYRKGMHLFGIMRSVVNLSFFIGIIFFVIYLLLRKRLKCYKTEWKVSEEAEKYYQKSAFTRKSRIVISAFIGGCSIIFMLFTPHFLTVKDLDTTFYVGDIIVVLSAFFSIF